MNKAATYTIRIGGSIRYVPPKLKDFGSIQADKAEKSNG